MRRITALIVALVVGLPLTATAVEDPAVPPRSPAELTAAVRQEIDLLAEVRSIPLPPKDRDAYLNYHLARVDLFIGSIRTEARAALGAFFTDPELATAVWFLGADATRNDIATALETRLFPTEAEERFAVEWVDLFTAISQLRSITAGGRPTRVCPVAGPTWFTDDFGDSRPWGRSHKGIDMNGDLGTPLAAIEAGTVIQANWHWAGGRQVWIRADATGDVYYYAHLDTWATWIWTGTRVEAGDVLGTLGWSGDADSAHLHFGWMPGSNEVDLANMQNAYPLLVELCQ